MPNLGPMEWILILLVLILLFGAKKLPDTAKALGQSLRMFKKETSKMSEEDESRQTTVKAETVTPPPAQIPPAGPSVEERLRTLEEENRKLRETQQPVSSQNEQRSN